MRGKLVDPLIIIYLEVKFDYLNSYLDRGSIIEIANDCLHLQQELSRLLQLLIAASNCSMSFCCQSKQKPEAINLETFL